MKKKLIIGLVLIVSNISKAQEFSYGSIIGYSFYEIGNNNGVNQFITKKNNTINLGGYLEYQFEI